MKTKWAAVLVLSLASSFAGHAWAQAPEGAGWFDNVGSLDFPTSGGPEAQKHFLRGVAVLHSFGWKQAIAEFQMAQELEPDFAMAYWGESLCYNHPLFGERDRESPREVLARLGDTPEERAAKAPTDREKGFLAAVEVLFGEGSLSERRIAYMEAMERLYNAYPEDPEVRALYSLALLSAAGPLGDTTFRVTVKAGTLALELFQANPNHPGAAHYTIHAFDDPVHAPLALPAAFRFAEIAPAVSHARHMPSHIFIQRGMWGLVSKSNDSAYEAAVDLWEPGDSVGDMVHSLDWGHYGDLERGDFAKAREWEKELDGIVERSEGASRATRTVSLLKARVMVETEEWEILDIDENSTSASLLVSGIAAAKKEDLATARTASELLKKRGAREVNDRSTFGRGAEPDRVMHLEVAALVKLAEGDTKATLELFERGVEVASAMGPPRGPATPVKPVHELYGETLLALDKPEEAAELFEAQLLQTPNRPLSVRGLARAHAAAGNMEAAAEQYEKLIEIREGRKKFAGVREARKFLAKTK